MVKSKFCKQKLSKADIVFQIIDIDIEIRIYETIDLKESLISKLPGKLLRNYKK